MLDWEELDGNMAIAHSAVTRQRYLVVREYGKLAVRLVRVPEMVPVHEPLAEVRAALATELIFTTLRGPGRVPMDIDVDAEARRIREMAERYDAGEDFGQYGPAWVHDGALVA